MRSTGARIVTATSWELSRKNQTREYIDGLSGNARKRCEVCDFGNAGDASKAMRVSARRTWMVQSARRDTANYVGAQNMCSETKASARRLVWGVGNSHRHERRRKRHSRFHFLGVDRIRGLGQDMQEETKTQLVSFLCFFSFSLNSSRIALRRACWTNSSRTWTKRPRGSGALFLF